MTVLKRVPQPIILETGHGVRLCYPSLAVLLKGQLCSFEVQASLCIIRASSVLQLGMHVATVKENRE